MKNFLFFVLVALVALLLAPELTSAKNISRKSSHNNGLAGDAKEREGSVVKPESFMERRGTKRRVRPDTVQIAGSSLPDCSHACGSCSPCRLVMVSFVCATLAEAETCPMAYKCTCNNKSYPVP